MNTWPARGMVPPPFAAVIVIAAVPVFPSLVARIVVDPVATPVTRPLEFTVATAVESDDQVIVRPTSMLPAESRVVAVRCRVSPTGMLPEVGLTVTDATGTRTTVIVAVPVFPSLVARIVVEPTATPVTRPLAFTVATDVESEDQVIVRPVRMLPAESRGVAVRRRVSPGCSVAER